MKAAWRSGPWLPALLPLVPLASAAARALRGGWYPIGDNAFFALRARDVLTDHHPLVGTWTSASLTVGTRINNPGPLLFDVLAGPARADVAAGTIVAVVVLHAMSALVAVHFAHRTAGLAGAWAAAIAFLALELAMGSEILVEPWQPHSLLPAFLTLLVLVWALVAGHAGALPWAAGFASLILQTHLSYAILVPLLSLTGVVALVTSEVRLLGWPRARARLRGPVVVSAVVVALAWAQPFAEQVGGDGNLGTVASEGSGGGPVAGAGFAARVLGSVVAVPGGWGPGGFEGLHVDLQAERPPGVPPHLDGVSDLGTAAPWLAGLAVLAILAVAVTQRRGDRAWGSALVVAGVGLAGAFATIALLPVSPVLGVAAHQVRPVWPVALFATASLLAALLAAVPRAVAVLPVAAGALLVAGLPAQNPHTGPSADSWAIPIVRDLVGQLDEVEGAGLVFVDLSVIRFAEPYSTPVLLELQRRGVEFVVDDDIAVGQLGPARARQEGDDVALELRIVDGGAAITPEPGWERIAYVAGLDRAETAELAALDARVEADDELDDREARRRADLEHRRTFESAAVLVRPAS